MKYNGAKIIWNIFFLPQEAGGFYIFYTFTENICSACNPMEVVVFSKNVLIL